MSEFSVLGPGLDFEVMQEGSCRNLPCEAREELSRLEKANQGGEYCETNCL